MISLDGVHRRYGRTRALESMNLRLDGGITVVLGPNGAGKTTLLRVLATALDPSGGSISLLGLNPRHLGERANIRRQLGYLPQGTDSNTTRMTVAGLIDYVAILKGHDDPHQRLHAIAQVVTGHQLGPYLDSRLGELSAGVRRRVLLAQAFLGRPRILTLDEPFTDLDPEQRRAAARRIAAVRAQAVAIVATHDIDEFVVGCDNLIILQDGRLQFLGTPAELSRLETASADVATGPTVPSLRRAYVMVTAT